MQERLFLSVSNYIFTAIFVAEMTVKVQRGGGGGSPGAVALALWPCRPCTTPTPLPHPQVVALGLVSGEHAYLQSSWNVLDGLLVLVSLIDIVVALASAGGAKILGILRVLRLLRTLRPLRWAGPGWGGAGGWGWNQRVGRGLGKDGGGARARGQSGAGSVPLWPLVLGAAPLAGPSIAVPSATCPESSAAPRASSWWWRL